MSEKELEARRMVEQLKKLPEAVQERVGYVLRRAGGGQTMKEYNEALSVLRMAENHFDFAAPEYIETAIMELEAAQRRVVAIVTREKINAAACALNRTEYPAGQLHSRVWCASGGAGAGKHGGGYERL